MKKIKDYPDDDIKLLELDEINIDLTKTFDCGITDLNGFIKNDALPQQKGSAGKTFLLISRSQKKILGFVTLCTDSIRLKGITQEDQDTIDLDYKTLPALKIGRMAVHNDFFHQKIGTKMLVLAIETALKINHFAGCRFLTVEAKNKQTLPEPRKPIHFYKKFGFKILKERKQNKSYVSMYMDMQPILNYFRKNSSKIESYSL
jgi:ribosomal protein S18 acetylase RimI-like enzyme